MTQFQVDAAILSINPVKGGFGPCISARLATEIKEKNLNGIFSLYHALIPGLQKVGKVHRQIIDAMVYKGPYVRFVWSFVTDSRLNHHPQPPPGQNQNSWKGRNLSAAGFH